VLQMGVRQMGVLTWACSPWFAATVNSTVLGEAIELALLSGHMVAAHGAAPSGLMDQVGVADARTFLVDGAYRLRCESRRPSLSGRSGDGERDGDGDGHHRRGCQECPEDRRGHESRSDTKTTKKGMCRPLSSPVARSLCGPRLR